MQYSDLKLSKYTKIDSQKIAMYVADMAIELVSAGEVAVASFVTTFMALEQSVGCLYTASKNDEVIGYALFTIGDEADFRRLYFFAVAKKYQRKGLGSNLLKAFITEELKGPKAALTVACKPSLAKFYEKQGFFNTGISDDQDDVVLTYSNDSTADPYAIRKKKFNLLKVDVKRLVAEVAKVEKDFGVDLSRVSTLV